MCARVRAHRSTRLQLGDSIRKGASMNLFGRGALKTCPPTVSSMLSHVSVHYALDIGTKGQNRPWFEKRLQKDVEAALAPLGKAPVHRLSGRLLAELPPGAGQNEVRERLSRVFGVSWFSFCAPVEATEEAIAKVILENNTWQKPSLVWVKVNRADKRFPIKSPEFGLSLARKVAQSLGCEAHSSSEAQALVEIVDGKALVSFEKLEGAGGLPAGSEGKIAVLLSGGIDSPVALWLLARRGCEPVAVHFHPFKEQEAEAHLEKIFKLCQTLAQYTPLKLYAVPFYPFLAASVSLPERTVLLAFRRFMLRVADAIADKEGALALASGESVGQVASQTLANLASVDAAARRPVLRPLVGMDKHQIIELAETIGTYKISLEKYADCCQSLVARHPATKSTGGQLDELEAQLDVPKLVEESVRLALVKKF